MRHHREQSQGRTGTIGHGWWALLVLVLMAAVSQLLAQSFKADSIYPLWGNLLKVLAISTTWPPDAFSEPDAPLVVGILGENAFDQAWFRQIENLTNGQHRVKILKCENVEQARKCHLLYIGIAEKDRWGQILNQLKGTSVLTAGETEEFARLGGIVSFYKTGKLSYDVNTKAAHQAKLAINKDVLLLTKANRR